MASSTSSDLKLELITTGEKSGTWGTITNTNLQILEQAASGYISHNIGAADLALDLSNGAVSNGKNLYFKLTGTLTANRTVTMPDSSERVFIVEDATTSSASNYTLTVKTVTGTGLTLPVKSTTVLYSDGTNITGKLQTKGYHTPSANYTAVNADTQNTFYTAKQMPEMKVIDFLSGLFKMFNLVVFKQDNDIYTALASWYMNIGNAYDITKYVDMETSTLERLFQYKEMDFKFKSKKSFLVQFADEINGVPFAEEDYGSDEWDGGVYKLEVPFEKMMYERLSNEDTGALSDIGQGAMLDKKFDATIGEPLLFCMDYTDGNGDWAIDGSTRETYWRPTQLTSSLWGGSGNGLALNFGLEMDEYLLEVPDGYDNLFSANYFDYVETVFDRQARMLKVSAYLPLSIITRYRLNDQFIIANKRYRINSIKTNLLTNKTDLELFNKEEYNSQILNDQVAWLGRVANLQSTTKDASSITISWDAVSGVTGYNIYVNGGLFSAEPSYITGIKVNLLESDTWYNITVRAKYDVDGNDVFSFDTGISEKTN